MADILDQSLREFAKQGQGFWHRLFNSVAGAFGVGKGSSSKLFDRALQQLGNNRADALRTYVATSVNKNKPIDEVFPKETVDHFVRSILRAAEQFGATANQLASIKWEDLDINELLTNDGKQILDLSKLPGMDTELVDIMSKISAQIGDGTTFLREAVIDTPIRTKDRMQAQNELTNKDTAAKQFEPLFGKMLRMIQAVSPASGSFGKNTQDDFWNKAASLLGTPTSTIRRGRASLNDRITQTVDDLAPAHTGESRLISLFQRMAKTAQPFVTGAGNRIFGLLPSFIQRPILSAAGRAAASGAAATGATQAGQAAAAAAGMGAARMAVAFRMVTLAGGVLAAGFGLAVAGLKKLSSAAWDTTMRVTQYSGALSMAMAQSRVADLRRDIRTGQALSGVGAARIQAETNLSNTMAPLEMAIGLMGNMIGTAFADLGSGLMDIANNILIEPLVVGLAAITEVLSMIGVVSEETRKNVVAGADKIVDAINNKNKQDAFDPLGGEEMPVRQLFNAMLNAPQQPQRVQNANNQPLVPNVAVPGLQNAAAQVRMNPGKL